MKNSAYLPLSMFVILLGLSGCVGKISPEVVSEMNNKKVSIEQVCKGSGWWMKLSQGKESCNSFYTPEMKDIEKGVRFKIFETTCYKMKGQMRFQTLYQSLYHECANLRVAGLSNSYTFNKDEKYFYPDVEKIESKKRAYAEEKRKAKLKKELEISNKVRRYNAVEDYCITLRYGLAVGGTYIPSTNSCEVSKHVYDRESVFAVIEELKKKGQAPTIVKYQNEAKKYKGTLDELCRDLANSSGDGEVEGVFDKETLNCQMYYNTTFAYNKKWADADQFKYDTMKPLLIKQHKQIIKQRKKQAGINESKRLAEEKERARKKAVYERNAKIKKGKQYNCSDGYDNWVLKYNGSRITFGEVNFQLTIFGGYVQNEYDRNPLYIDRAKGTVKYGGNTSTCKLR